VWNLSLVPYDAFRATSIARPLSRNHLARSKEIVCLNLHEQSQYFSGADLYQPMAHDHGNVLGQASLLPNLTMSSLHAGASHG
jgi:hypothetical protein